MSIRLDKITKYFGKQKVLDDFSLTVELGEFHVLLGPSGGGKSTLLKIIAGLLKPDSGNVWINGRIVNNIPPQERKIGFVFQDYALFPHLTVYENVAYGLKARGIKGKILDERVTKYLELIRLEDCKHKYPTQLSGGQKQRVALARSLVIEPQVLLLDEPLSHIDAWQREELREELKRIQKKTSVTTLYVTHDQMEAMILADKISILHQGRIEQVESPKDVFYRPKTPFVASFVGATNILRGKILKCNNTKAEFLILHKELTQPLVITVKKYPLFQHKKEISLCLHPEKIFLKESPEKENSFLGRVLDIIPQGTVLKVMVEIHGLKLQVLLPKRNFDLSPIKEYVWVCFSADAPHPLCDKCYRVSKS